MIYRNELYHHGIKGMRWGIRRYQNPDGSLTEAGKKRYSGVDSSDERKMGQLDKSHRDLAAAYDRYIESEQKRKYKLTADERKSIKNARYLDARDSKNVKYLPEYHDIRKKKDFAFWKRLEDAEIMDRLMSQITRLPKEKQEAAKVYVYELLYMK